MPIEGAFGHASRTLQLLLEAYAGARLPDWPAFAGSLRMVRLPAGEVLCNAGDAHPYIYIVHSGLTRAQARTNTGHTSTVFFSEEGDIVASLTSLSPRSVRRVYERGLHPRLEDLEIAVKGKSLHTISAVETSVLVRGDYRVVERLAHEHHAWSTMMAAMSTVYAMTQQADAVWSRDSPEDRYRSLLKDRPNLVSRLTQRDLASYLNVTETTMSRIAKRVRGVSDEDGEEPDGVEALAQGRDTMAR